MKKTLLLFTGIFSVALLGTAQADPRFSFGFNLGSECSRPAYVQVQPAVEYVWVQPPSQYVRMPDGNYVLYTPPPQRVAVAAQPQCEYRREPSFPVGLFFGFGGGHNCGHERHGWRH